MPKKYMLPGAGSPIPADAWNDNFALLFMDDVDITYDENGRIATITHNETTPATVWTITYNDNDQVATVTDGTTTWTYSYNDEGYLSAINYAP